MILIPSNPPTPWFTTLAVDAMCYHMARQLRSQAASSLRDIARAEEAVEVHKSRIASLNAQLEEGEIDEATHYDLVEPLAIEMDNVEYRVGVAYGLLIEHVGAVHVLCASSLEAHINIRADRLLTGRNLKAFERLQLEAKWLFLPRLLGLAGFDPGIEPFQGFDRLIRLRNRLVHYKPEREEWFGGTARPPAFLADLGLTLEAADDSLKSVQGMVSDLAKQLGDTELSWLDSDSTNFFKIGPEESPKPKP
jgi:hypothetical protein